MKIAVIQFPGSNCEAESLAAVREAGMEGVEFLWNQDPAELKDFDGFFIVGGFSYEDRSRSGIIASLDPLMPHLSKEAIKGKPIIGVCNGAQILVETGLVPGLAGNQTGLALAVNKRMKNGKILGTGYYNAWVNVKLSVPSEANAFTRHIKQGQIIRVPVAHGEGRFVIPDELLEEMIDHHLTALRYCDNEGVEKEEFPTNPNGAVYNLAAVTNIYGNVMAIMPHPERTPAGQPFFTSMREYISEKKTINLEKSLRYAPPPLKLAPFHRPIGALEVVSQLIITDNEAATVQNALKELGIDAKLERSTHWEIVTKDEAEANHLKKTIVASGELFNPNKEKHLEINNDENDSVYLLIRYRDDFEGKRVKEAFIHRHGVENIKEIKKGTLWKITAEHGNIQALLDKILETKILFNQFSQECYLYR